MKRLKADLHTHAADDPTDGLSYSAEMLIDAASQLNFDVVAITCHKRLVYTERLAEYARRRKLLLIPGVELDFGEGHIVVLNPDEEQCAAAGFDELRAARGRGEVIIAPHPFYPTSRSLRGAFVENVDLFDAVEYCALHAPGVNLNRRAVRVARKHGLPLVGTSDTHGLPYAGDTYSWIEAAPSVAGVLEAVRAGRVDVVTRRAPMSRFARVAQHVVCDFLKGVVGMHEEEVRPS